MFHLPWLQAVKNRDKVFPFIQSIREQQIALTMTNLLKADMEVWSFVALGFVVLADVHKSLSCAKTGSR